MNPRRFVYPKAALGVVAGLSGFLSVAPIAFAADIEVPLDQVRVLTFQAPVKTVFVGNPVIADVTVIDPMHVFILGKNFGTTNVVALDSMGRESMNEQVTVLARPGSTVTVQRGASKMTLNCNSMRCEAQPTPGDDTAPYDAVAGQKRRA
jgi:Flp pilus assembly secretin CpaC